MHICPHAKGMFLSLDFSQMTADRHDGTNRCMFANFNCECTRTYIFKKKYFYILKNWYIFGPNSQKIMDKWLRATETMHLGRTALLKVVIHTSVIFC